MIGLAINTEPSIVNLILQRTIQIHLHLEKINMFQINWLNHGLYVESTIFQTRLRKSVKLLKVHLS
jgi:hypothetical protein